MEVMENPTAQADFGGLAMLSAGLASCLAKEKADSNLVFSPLSMYASLALLAAGARGATLDEILRFLGVPSRGELEQIVGRLAGHALKDQSESGGPRVAFVCGVWSELTCPLKPAFREAVVGTYKAEASHVDFINNPEAARAQINAWVAQSTRNLIDSVLGPQSITPLTRVVLGNAIYFNGKWIEPFDESQTQKKLFYRLDGSTVDVPFMQSWDSQLIGVHDGFKVLKLRYQMVQSQGKMSGHHVDHFNFIGQTSYTSDPYSESYDYHPALCQKMITIIPGRTNVIRYPDVLTGHANVSSDRNKHTQFSMCVFLPDDLEGLPNLVAMIASHPSFVHDHLPKKKIDVNQFRVPKFKLSFESSVVTILKKLGLQLPFGDEADLSDMVDRDEFGLPMVVSDVIHKAVIEVNEQGTEAAAVTMMTVRLTCLTIQPRPPPPVDFVADHPFAYFLVEEVTGAIVFAGHVLDPSKD